MFDPCPAGWRVPKNGPDNLSPWSAFTVENSTWNGEATNPSGGRFYDRSVVYGPTGAWYPANGVRYANTSYLNECEINGYAWSATYVGELTYRFFCRASTVEPARTAYGWRAHSFSVRCVRE
ncbi:hypothetical protein [uncultured Rikenella sp.]|uniref:hypothetical protein n=1 Tax=uncultured Rikenella sp. TaxID=368003 RepID=UPI00261264DF|nr:hypothetical protein [uncultured Rikenella sp.]